VSSSTSSQPTQASGIGLVQGPKTSGYSRGVGGTSGTTFTITLGQVPVSGDMLIVTFSSYYASTSGSLVVSSISGAGATWGSSASASNVYGTSSGDIAAQIWLGTVGASPTRTITVTVSRSLTSSTIAVANAAEWSGLSSTQDQVVQTQTGSNSGPTGTGTTGTLAQANELAVASVVAQSTASGSPVQSSPKNGFTLFDGGGVAAGSEYASNGYLYYINTSGTTGLSTGDSLGGYSNWAACIVTFK